jgi:hypothetical protein
LVDLVVRPAERLPRPSRMEVRPGRPRPRRDDHDSFFSAAAIWGTNHRATQSDPAGR